MRGRSPGLLPKGQRVLLDSFAALSDLSFEAWNTIRGICVLRDNGFVWYATDGLAWNHGSGSLRSGVRHRGLVLEKHLLLLNRAGAIAGI